MESGSARTIYHADRVRSMRGPDWRLRRRVKGILGWLAFAVAALLCGPLALVFAGDDGYGALMLWLGAMAWLTLPCLLVAVASLLWPPRVPQAPGVKPASLALVLAVLNILFFAWLVAMGAFDHMT